MPPPLHATVTGGGQHDLRQIEELIRAGQFGPAMERLNALWDRSTSEERHWYLRLWILAGQGRVLEALELCREAGLLFPGSVAIASFRAVLERTAGDEEVALECALRAAALRPGPGGPERLLAALLGEPDPDSDAPATGERPGPAPGGAPPPSWLDPARAAGVFVQWLLPQGAAARTPLEQPGGPAKDDDRGAARQRQVERRRLRLLLLATGVAALVATRDPLLAAAGLAFTVGWLARAGRGPSSRG